VDVSDQLAHEAHERVLAEGDDLRGELAWHRFAEPLGEQLPAQLAAAAPPFPGDAEPIRVRPVRLVPEDPVCPGLNRRVCPRPDEGPELGAVRAACPHGTAVVEDLPDFRVDGDKEALGFTPEGVPDAPWVYLNLEPHLVRDLDDTLHLLAVVGKVVLREGVQHASEAASSEILHVGGDVTKDAAAEVRDACSDFSPLSVV